MVEVLEDRIVPSYFPPTTTGIHVFEDQLPDLSSAMVQFLATHTDGTQKQTLNQIAALRAVNPNYTLLHYQLGTGNSPYDYIINNLWSSDWSYVNQQESWFAHQSYSGEPQSPTDLGSVRVSNSTGWDQADIANPAWQQYTLSQVFQNMAATDANGWFADSFTYGLGGAGYNNPIPTRYQGDNAANSANWPGGVTWTNQFSNWAQTIETAFTQHNTSDGTDYQFIPNLDAMVTSWEPSWYDNASGVPIMDGAFLEAFGEYTDTYDWTLSMNRGLNFTTNNKIVIMQPYLQDTPDSATGQQERNFYLGTYLLLKGNETYLNMFYGSGAQYFPEYQLNLGAALTPLPTNVSSYLWNGVYRRDFQNGFVLVNPGTTSYTLKLGESYQEVQGHGGGMLTDAQLDANGNYIGGSLTYQNASSVTLAGGTAAIFLDPTNYAVSVVGSPSLVAGHSFLFTVQAIDQAGNPVTSYSGPTTVTIKASPPDSLSNFPITTGALNSSGFGFFLGTLETVGSYTLTASATQASATYTGTSSTIAVTPAAAAYFMVTAPTSAVSGAAVNVTVTAYDLYHNVVTGYTGTVKLTSTDAGASLGKNYAFTSGPGQDNGSHTFLVTLLTPGSQTITVTDTTATAPEITGISNPISVTGLQVTSIVGNATGFTVNFNKPFDPTTLKLYGTAPYDPDMLFYMTNASAGPAQLTGSVVPNATDTAFTYVETTFGDENGGLPNGVYDVSLLAGRASDGMPGLKDTNGVPLDASNSPNNSPDLYSTLLGQSVTAYSTSFVLSTISPFTDTTQKSPTQVAVSLPAFAQGPELPVQVQVHDSGGAGGTYLGIPATISDGNKASTVSFSVAYNTALLTVTGGVVDPSILGRYPHATFNRTATGAPVAGVETDTFTFSTGDGTLLAIGSAWTLGDITANVPNVSGQQIYKSKQVLTVSSVSSNGTVTNLVGGNGFQVVTYLGDTSGDGNIQLNDATIANNVDNPFIGGGFPAFPMVDPVVLADTDGAGFVDSSSVGNIASLAIGHAQATIPTPPAGRITASGGADPALSLPGQVIAASGVPSTPATAVVFQFAGASISVLPPVTPMQRLTAEVFADLARQTPARGDQGLINYDQVDAGESTSVNDQALQELFARMAYLSP